MISKVTESNKDKIKERLQNINKAFWDLSYNEKLRVIAVNPSSPTEAEKATAAEWADENAKQIPETLEGYYANIREIATLTTSFNNAPYRFFLMPLDEPMFEIDANKRTITVPSVFSKNGVGVKGDHMAEVLYFKVDRYFDYQDLFSVDRIIINWQFRPANSSRNAELKTYTSYALAPDDTYEPGSVVFGWVIGNFIDENGEQQYMTPSKGSLSFSVSFLKKGTDGKFAYAFNTQTATVNINDSLALENVSQLDSVKDVVFERLMNSSYTVDNMEPLKTPVFLTGALDEETEVYSGLPEFADFYYINNGEAEADTLDLLTLGYVSDDGIIEYTWEGTPFVGDPVSSVGQTDYVPTVDQAPKDGKIYYAIDEENVERYVQLEGEDLTAAFNNALITVYEKGNKLVVSDAGRYIVTLQSKKSVPNGSDFLQSESISSNVCVVPWAAVPKVELSVQGVTPDSAHITDAEEAAKWTFIESSAPQVTASISIDEEKIDGERVTNNSSIGFIGLKMTNAAGDAGRPTAAEIAGMSFIRHSNGHTYTVDSASANGEGTYKVYAVNKRNKTYSISDASNELKVSCMAPALAHVKVESVEDELTLINDNNKVGEAKIEIASNDNERNFVITISDDLACVDTLAGDRKDIDVKIYEIVASDYEADPSVITYIIDRDAESDVPNFYEAAPVEGANNKFAFTITNDPGLFVVELTTKYHGTKNTVVTEPFKILST